MPKIWLLSDARNDAALEQTLRRLPRGSGFVYRHYHLDPVRRQARFGRLAAIARGRGHVVALSAPARQARAWGADAIYGAPGRIAGAEGLLRLATAHSMRELAAARRSGADAVFVSPVFATASHPGARSLGPVQALLLARRAGCPAILLGGMDASRFRAFRRVEHVHGWAAIDGLSAA
ncbi:thiamine phosphate synthase [Croceicoccus marinus]|uniref:Thiamine phosphate synthase n=1 Tax=Croceicoccus marinus TaxID=450378 RepID=A0A1Z1FFF2_9SPHN|nr:thiamine phosphate synthase [Croceicoccus marinus]ARU17492.1 thiamine phosphate synthase [Croceicoccus marinus]